MHIPSIDRGWLLLVVFSFLLAGCAKSLSENKIEKISSSDASALAWIFNGDYKVVTSFCDMPKDVKNKIPPMADPNQEFNSTDVMIGNLPTRRFTTGGFSNDMTFIVYEHGGFVYMQKLVIIRRNKSAAVLFFGYCRPAVRSLEELKAAIENGKIEKLDNQSPWF